MLSLSLVFALHYEAISNQNIHHRKVVKQKNEAAKRLEANVCGLVEVVFEHFHARTEKNHKKSVMEDVLGEIRTEKFPNTSLERYRCVTQSGYYYYYLLLTARQFFYFYVT